ncbi:unnamed protein product [Paramecium sonneborni]|uniref:Transmembrane protein n=1 Tax=Paramecium sonneborni TaxID=65129 RepID=A0A8S1RFG5_9CILI|nr:unnamed protein product [Paramecium sonneborni]
MQFKIIKEYHYKNMENEQPKIPTDVTALEQRNNTKFIQTSSDQELLRDIGVIPQVQPLTIFNQRPQAQIQNRQNLNQVAQSLNNNDSPLNKNNKNNHQNSSYQQIQLPKNANPQRINNIASDSSNSQSQQNNHIIRPRPYQGVSQSRHTRLRVPALFWTYLALFFIIFAIGISIFSTQSDEIAILVFEVFIMILNLISGCYYYSKSTDELFNEVKCFRIFFCILLAELLFSFIQFLICLIKNIGFALSLINALFLFAFLLALYFLKKKFKKGQYQTWG